VGQQGGSSVEAGRITEVSGPLRAADLAGEPAGAQPRTVEISESRESTVGTFPVRRALPRRQRRTVGAWCFVDHMGPAAVTADRGLGVAPHPHIGLQTVTWLFDGEALHRDSLGSEQTIRPGQLNLMTAGNGVAHSEEGTGYSGPIHGVQLWVAQPDATRTGPAAFEHHAELPRVEFGGAGAATVLVGAMGPVVSPARRDTDHVGVDVELAGGVATLPVRADHEYGLVVFDGAVEVDGATVTPGHLAYLGTGRDELALASRYPARALLIGGAPFAGELVMWWNYVGRSQDEIVDAHDQWTRRDDRFGTVASPLPPIDVAPPPWRPAGERPR
jgi:redox-sensitive bicupin YhaK (pirin superfamily)